MKSRTKAIVIIIIFLIIIAAVATFTITNRVRQPKVGLVHAVERTRQPVQTLVLKPQTLVERLVATGVLKAKQDVVISAEVAGKVKRVQKELGDKCKKGELLLKLDSENYEIAVAQARAALTQGQVALDHAKRDWRRMQKLKESAVATAQQLDGAEGAQSSAQASVELNNAALRAAKRNLRETSVRCPFTGLVAERMVDVGQAVLPQTPLARLVDTSQLKLSLSVIASELSRIEIGQAVTLNDPSIKKAYSGTVSRLGVAADPATRNFPVEIVVNDKDSSLRAGQIVHVTLMLKEHEDVLAVPVEAVIETGGTKSVFVTKKNQAKKVTVTTGPQIDDQVIVLKGLNTDDEVIRVGADDLTDGDLLNIVDREKMPNQKDAGESSPSSQ